MADEVGLKIVDIEFNDVNGGSFSVVVARADSDYDQSPALDETIAREQAAGFWELDVYAAFAERVEQSRSDLLALIEEARHSHQTVAALGASTKGNVVLQYCGLTSEDILGVGEVNEDKYGAFTPGSHIPIMPEQDILNMEPDYLVVLPWHFRATFRAKQTKGGSRLVFPLPELEVLDS
jgi:NDP-4-keto-2,6-dideoxyhexose 3-C-methyltransferase